MLTFSYSTQMYVEADAKMDTYQAQDGTNRRTLNLLMRKLISLFITACLTHSRCADSCTR